MGIGLVDPILPAISHEPTVSPVEKPVASAAYGFVRFIGGGLAPYAAGRMFLAVNIHFPFYIGAGAILLGIVILSTAHRLLTQAERTQAEQIAAATAPADTESAGAVLDEAGPDAPGKLVADDGYDSRRVAATPAP